MKYLKGSHPKNSNLLVNYGTFDRIISRGWVGQRKMNGFRLECHVDVGGEITAYTRQGTKHTRKMSEAINLSFLQLEPEKGTSVFDCEWVKPLNQVFLFDILAHEGKVLNKLTYQERYELLETVFKITPHMRLLPLYEAASDCIAQAKNRSKYVEGLVFKALNTKGWPDTSVVRCRISN